VPSVQLWLPIGFSVTVPAVLPTAVTVSVCSSLVRDPPTALPVVLVQ